MGSVFFTLLIGVLNISWAFSPEVLDVFVQTNEQSYRPLMCSDTIYQLVQNFKNKGFDLREAEVLMIKHKWVPHEPVLPQKARRRYKDHVYSQYPRWTFHVVLVWQHQVFDFDYTDELQVVPYDEYMAQMWKAEELVNYELAWKMAFEYSQSDLFGVF
ncbi:hypothetical protein K2X05_08460 [bacterium]|nr:hypothetical protein [bacterium]